MTTILDVAKLKPNIAIAKVNFVKYPANIETGSKYKIIDIYQDYIVLEYVELEDNQYVDKRFKVYPDLATASLHEEDLTDVLYLDSFTFKKEINMAKVKEATANVEPQETVMISSAPAINEAEKELLESLNQSNRKVRFKKTKAQLFISID